MFSKIRPSYLIKSDQFIREPVDKKCDEIIEDKAKEIILAGGRGTGKSTILCNLEHRGLGEHNPTINTQFDSVVSYSLKPNNIFNEEFFRHYYELMMARKLIIYIKTNYPFAYDKYFKTYDELCFRFIEELHGYGTYNSKKSLAFINVGEITRDLIAKIKDVLNLDSLNLAIDRFDWANGRSAYVQTLLSEYFPLFDKVILTTDDDITKIKENLDNKKIHIMEADYSKDPDFINFLLAYRSREDNNCQTYLSLLNGEQIQKLIKHCSGNIDVMFVVLNDLFDRWQFHNGALDADKELDQSIEKELTRIRMIESVSIAPKLHLYR